ncbi:hypothetical protein INT43_005341 [Umbelopsis isabellina]|uniref:Uncharacterized protein n=1 Tax=Mortierella isabellina TaxID=91625 RepID=A0A8H7UDP2_MORIS|nr:hypothetical protein INT43_005341 [Umbelopsis isabellina]
MGCCISMPHLLGKPLVYEVKLDEAGVAYRVESGTGTHYIHINGDEEMFIEEKIRPQMMEPLDMDGEIPPPSYTDNRYIAVPSPAAKLPAPSTDKMTIK